MSDMENKEWMDEYTSIKQVSKSDPFTVPPGYFDNLEDRIVSLKNLQKQKDKIATGGFLVPENYFEGLAGNISGRINVETYADAGAGGFTVPDNYFETLEQQIAARVFIEETKCDEFGNFTVPAGYFNELNNHILNRTINFSDKKKNGIIKKLVTSTAFKYATAACVAFAIGIGILLNGLLNPLNEHNNSFLHKQLSTVPVDEIKNYLQLNVDAGETQHMILTEGTPINDDKLQDALQNYADSIQ